ncbi:hypothetical protein [Alteribacter aurantiacus]|uniref:hypothetical protein n=1 Tax=Alteribacter aurantiacus TaxID=254410 RepID=UPI0012ECB74F|nr:hypothetical protein [Alteribacter aurantiacus]
MRKWLLTLEQPLLLFHAQAKEDMSKGLVKHVQGSVVDYSIGNPSARAKGKRINVPVFIGAKMNGESVLSFTK